MSADLIQELQIESIAAGLRAAISALFHTDEAWAGTAPDQPHICCSPENIRVLLDTLAANVKEIAEIRTENERLRAALKPFGRANDIDPALPDDTWLGVKYEDVFVAHCTAGDFRAASRSIGLLDGEVA